VRGWIHLALNRNQSPNSIITFSVSRRALLRGSDEMNEFICLKVSSSDDLYAQGIEQMISIKVGDIFTS